jgi:hypothetical protein
MELSVLIQKETWQSGHLYPHAHNIKYQAYFSKGSEDLRGKRRVREEKLTSHALLMNFRAFLLTHNTLLLPI